VAPSEWLVKCPGHLADPRSSTPLAASLSAEPGPVYPVIGSDTHVDGQVLLLDLDNFAIGPPEWDLTLTATYYSSFQWHSEAEYRQFADIYGYDVLELSGFQILREIRELHMLSWIMQNVSDNPRVAAEFRKRVATVRDDIFPRGWDPF
jgi:hypothetical protein